MALRNEILGGGFVIVIGIVSVVEASRLSLGNAISMGPGYFPLYVGLLMLAIGAVLIFEGWRLSREGRASQSAAYPLKRSIIFVSASVLSFALLVERAGLVPAVAASVFLGCLADKEQGLRQTLILTAIIPILAVAIFQWGLGMNVRAFRW